MIHVNRAGKNLGQFSEQAVSDGLSAGTFLPSDLGWIEGWEAWQPLSTFTDLPPSAVLSASPGTSPPLDSPPLDFQKPGKINFGECLSKAWECFQQNWGIGIVGTLIFFAISSVAQIPMQLAQPGVQYFIKQGTMPPLWVIITAGIAFLIFWLVSLGISAILPAGFFYFFIETLRNKKGKLGDIFIGFREGNWIQLLMAMLVWMVAFFVLTAVLLGPGIYLTVTTKSEVPIIVAGALLLIPFVYFAVVIGFVFPLIVDRKIGFWEAIVTCFKTVHRQWFQTLGLLILVGLVMMAGLLACCVGLLASMPLAYLIYSQGYRQLFGDQESRPR
jgi:hypothetical protein